MAEEDFSRLAHQEWENFKKVIRRHPTEQWLTLISNVDNAELDTFSNPDREIACNIQPFQRLSVIDAAIRFSNDFRGTAWGSDRAALEELARAGFSYLGSDWKFHELLRSEPKYGTRLAVARSFHEQFPPRYLRATTLFARANILFQQFDDRLREKIGLSCAELLRVAIALIVFRQDKRKTTVMLNDLIAPSYGLSEGLIHKFLDWYAADYERYRSYPVAPADSDGRYKFKALWRYPIIRKQDMLWIPLVDVLLKAVSENIFYALLETYPPNTSESNAFLQQCGDSMEAYVQKLFESAGVPIVRCDQILGIKGYRADFYTDTSIPMVVECKRVTPFRRDTMLTGNILMLKEDLCKMGKAYVQVDNTIKAMKRPECRGYIITLPEFPFSSNPHWQEMIVDFSGVQVDSQISVLSVADIEMLTCLTPDEINQVLASHQMLSSQEKGYLQPFLCQQFPGRKWRHPLLESSFDKMIGTAFPGIDFSRDD